MYWVHAGVPSPTHTSTSVLACMGVGVGYELSDRVAWGGGRRQAIPRVRLRDARLVPPAAAAASVCVVPQAAAWASLWTS